jgi:hypothetical protein
MSAKQTALNLLQAGPACGQELVDAGVGWRYAARIHELRSDGYEIATKQCGRHYHRSRMVEYWLVTYRLPLEAVVLDPTPIQWGMP